MKSARNSRQAPVRSSRQSSARWLAPFALGLGLCVTCCERAEAEGAKPARAAANPWEWQDQFGYSQANSVQEPKRVVYLSGQAAFDQNGTLQHAGDMAQQIKLSFDNVEQVLEAAGMSLDNVTRLTYYTTNVEELLANWSEVSARVTVAQPPPAITVLGVTKLAQDALVEIEATAVE
ncbi:MAG TPA: RidA family protein [Polyangiaceae bacterium]|nr:RidA family protein [Polyangiaceae bacterium]